MIIPPKQPTGYLATAWVGGIALAVLIVGVYGAAQPLLPRIDDTTATHDPGDEVLLEQFDPPPANAMEKPPETKPMEEPDIEIPPLPAIMPPLTPPEMVELKPLQEPPPPRPTPRHMPPKVKAESESKHAPAPRPSNDGGEITTFTGGGSGRFPSPAYPATARAARQEGSVHLLVTVEADGVPSSVIIQSSSGSVMLDDAARDQISRRWRWPAGAVRHYVVPVRFILK
jgi:protein TonB